MQTLLDGQTSPLTEDRSRSLRRIVGGALALVLTVTVGVASATVAHADAASDEVAMLVNAERSAHGRPPLLGDHSLNAAATEWAQTLANGADFAHSTNAWRQQRARPGYRACCGENIAAGQGTPAAVMQSWMGSSGHRSNILNGDYTHIGVGHVHVPGSRYGHYWVQIFAVYPASTAPQPAHADFVRALYRDFLGRSATAAEVAHWSDQLARGASRHSVASALSRSDEWIASVVTRFYRDTLNRAPDAAGLDGWVRAARAGMPIAQIAAAFYASPEYYQTVGQRDPQTWVRDLYRVLLRRSPDAAGVAHWTGRLASGTSRDTVAYSFYQSEETSRVRVDSLYRALLGRPAEPGGLRTWAPIVRSEGDLALAAFLASSEEYFRRAQR